MNKNIIFTICAKNYIGLAKILQESLEKHNKNTDFLIFVADEFSGDIEKYSLPENVIIAKDTLDISNSRWTDMSFKYNLTEFCTSIKPSAFLYLCENTSYEKIIYLDPDIYIYNSIDIVLDMLNKHSIVLTPHLSKITENYLGDLPDIDFLGNGIFNLGFCAIKNNSVSKRMLLWWRNKLVNNCFIDPYENCFTDQKWMDFLPAYFDSDELLITRHLGLNLAPWNFYERKIYTKNEILFASYRDENEENDSYPIIFVHFSGYDYKSLMSGKVAQKNIDGLKLYEDINLLTDIYSAAILNKRQEFERYIDMKYSYNTFDNDTSIIDFHRRIYRSLIIKGENIVNPFSTDDNTFYQRLKHSKMIKRSSINLDKVTKNNLQGVDGKLVIFNKLTRFLYKILGFERYLLIIKLLRPYSRFETQIHLISKKFDDNNIK